MRSQGARDRAHAAALPHALAGRWPYSPSEGKGGLSRPLGELGLCRGGARKEGPLGELPVGESSGWRGEGRPDISPLLLSACDLAREGGILAFCLHGPAACPAGRAPDQSPFTPHSLARPSIRTMAEPLISLAVDAQCDLGESPIWVEDAAGGTLFCVVRAERRVWER